MEAITMSYFLKQAAASFGAPPEPSAFLTMDSPQTQTPAQKQPVMLPNAAFEQTPTKSAPKMFDDDDDDDQEVQPIASAASKNASSKDTKVHFLPKDRRSHFSNPNDISLHQPGYSSTLPPSPTSAVLSSLAYNACKSGSEVRPPKAIDVTLYQGSP